MPKSNREDLVLVWNDEDLLEAWLLTPDDGILTPFDHAVAAELNRRAMGVPRNPTSQRERFWRNW